jgi:hypothetical protein
LKRAYAERWLRLALILINIAWLLFGIDPWPCDRLDNTLGKLMVIKAVPNYPARQFA